MIATWYPSPIDELARNTRIQEEDIKKQFYQKYHGQLLSLFNHLQAENSKIKDKDLLLEKTQKLLSRLVFILFCQGSSRLLPPDTLQKNYRRSMDSLIDSEERVWNEFRGLFHSIDRGNTRVRPPIHAYDGGLFAQDRVLDGLMITDQMWTELIQLVMILRVISMLLF